MNHFVRHECMKFLRHPETHFDMLVPAFSLGLYPPLLEECLKHISEQAHSEP